MFPPGLLSKSGSVLAAVHVVQLLAERPELFLVGSQLFDSDCSLGYDMVRVLNKLRAHDATLTTLTLAMGYHGVRDPTPGGLARAGLDDSCPLIVDNPTSEMLVDGKCMPCVLPS